MAVGEQRYGAVHLHEGGTAGQSLNSRPLSLPPENTLETEQPLWGSGLGDQSPIGGEAGPGLHPDCCSHLNSPAGEGLTRVAPQELLARGHTQRRTKESNDLQSPEQRVAEHDDDISCHALRQVGVAVQSESDHVP